MLLEQMLEEQEKQVNRGKSVEEIHCAATMAQGAIMSEMQSELQRISEQLSNIEMNTRDNSNN